jgi:hypothetical protein
MPEFNAAGGGVNMQDRPSTVQCALGIRFTRSIVLFVVFFVV